MRQAVAARCERITTQTTNPMQKSGKSGMTTPATADDRRRCSRDQDDRRDHDCHQTEDEELQEDERQEEQAEDQADDDANRQQDEPDDGLRPA